jgi:gliding motility-associated lipoprotein GldD
MKRILMVRMINYITIILFTLYGCRELTVPKPRGYFRIDLPAKNYTVYNEPPNKNCNLPFVFEYPVYGHITLNPDKYGGPGWFNIEFPRFNSTLYLTYIDIQNDLDSLIEQTYVMNVKNHVIKADAINEQPYRNPQNKVYGILYDLKGNAASAVQFYVTDSIKHYLRGSLYFSAEPNADSLAPLIDFFREDIIHMIETLKWKEN